MSPGRVGSDDVRLTLRDDSEVVVRPIRPADKGAIADGLTRMSEQSRYQRFLTPVASFSEADLRYLTEVDHHDHEALIAFDSTTGDGVGVARFVRLADGTSAEAAITVVDDWQGRGLGSTLANLLAERAREEGVARFISLLLASNRQMLDLLASLGPAREVSRHDGTVEIEVAIPERGIGDQIATVLRAAAGGAVDVVTPPWGLRRPSIS
jgi:GNAT superfamily N-acetyltransferase